MSMADDIYRDITLLSQQMMSIGDEAGRAIRRHRRRRGWTQGELATQAGVSRSFVIAAEQGAAKSLATLERILATLGLGATFIETKNGIATKNDANPRNFVAKPRARVRARAGKSEIDSRPADEDHPSPIGGHHPSPAGDHHKDSSDA